ASELGKHSEFRNADRFCTSLADLVRACPDPSSRHPRTVAQASASQREEWLIVVNISLLVSSKPVASGNITVTLSVPPREAAAGLAASPGRARDRAGVGMTRPIARPDARRNGTWNLPESKPKTRRERRQMALPRFPVAMTAKLGNRHAGRRETGIPVRSGVSQFLGAWAVLGVGA